LLPARLRERQGHAALVPADERPPERDPVLLPAHLPEPVAARVLDLDDVGAVVAEERRDHGAGEERGAVDHAQPGQREGRAVRHAWRSAARASWRRNRWRARW